MKKGEFFLKSVLCGALLATFNRLAVAGDSTDSTDTTQASSTSTENFTGYITEDFTGQKTNNKWLMPNIGGGQTDANNNGACLTAGETGTNYVTPTASTAGSPPPCPSTHEKDGHGALRLTPAENHRAGGIVSNFTFPTNNGVEIRFTTYSWGGNGADGMSFMLLNADDNNPSTLGAVGGSLGYSCSQNTSNTLDGGVLGGYLAVGIDEFGSFINKADNTATGEGKTPDSIGIRGAGSINYTYLENPSGFLQQVWTQHDWGTVPDAIAKKWAINYSKDNYWNLNGNHDNFRKVCSTGEFTVPGEYTETKKSVTMSEQATDDANKLYDYPYLAHSKLSESLDSPKVKSRAEATPMSYRIKITPSGILSVWYSYNQGEYVPIRFNGNDETKITDNNGPLPKLFRFAFAGSTGGSTNNHDVMCFVAAPNNLSEGSAETNLPEASYTTDAQVYSALYSPLYWTGTLIAQSIALDEHGNPSIVQTANWDASCNLTGGSCDNTGNENTPVQSERHFYSWNNKGVPLIWDDLSDAQRSALKSDGESDDVGKERLAFLKGDRSKEATSADSGGLFRVRRNVLADIINSSPTWVGYPNSTVNERASWEDNLHGTNFTPSESYADFESNQQSRTNVVYIGANDGFLHAFRSGHYDAADKFNTTDNDGEELFSYMPAAVLSRIHNANNNLDFSGYHYAHNFYVDATPGTGDVYYDGKWHTWLLGGLGAGGNSMYALDITNPDTFSASDVKGDWTYNASDSVWQHLGNTYGTPVFGRFHDGNWGAVFGNGWCSSLDNENGNCTTTNSPAGVYVMTIDKDSGAVSFHFLSTDVGSADSLNGIAYATPYDVDGDGIIDYIYAGDLQGNVWRFSVNGDTPTSWEQAKPQLIYATGSAQPITTKVLVSKSNGKILLNFGTGRNQEGYLKHASEYATGTQSVYGIVDSTASNELSNYDVSGNTQVLATKGQLKAQTIDKETNEISQNPLDWKNANYKGWYLDLTDTTVNGNTVYEQLIWNIELQDNHLIINTYIDDKDSIVSCQSSSATGYTYALDSRTGAGLSNFWIESTHNTIEVGSKRQLLSASGTSSIIKINGEDYMIYKTLAGEVSVVKVNASQNKVPGLYRISWRDVDLS